MKAVGLISVLFVTASCTPQLLPSEQRPDPGDSHDADPGLPGDAGSTAFFDAGSGVGREACEPLISKRCDYLQRCGLISSDSTTWATCTAFFTATWCGPSKWLSRTNPAVNTIRYDAVKAKACADAFDSFSCADWATEPSACGQFLLPNAQLRQACYDGYSECVEGVCRGVTCGDRRCRPLGLEGEDCRVATDCQQGLFCRATKTPGVGVCSKPAAVGETCAGQSECAAGLTCLGQCLALPAVGAECVMGRCDAQGYCGAGGDGGVCLPRLYPGEKCTGDGQCAPQSVCDLSLGACVPKTVLTGSVCSAEQVCAGGLACIYIEANRAKTCQPELTVASRCTLSSDCQNHLKCNDDGRCVARGEAGSSCVSARDCGIFLSCDNHLCVPRPVLGQSCAVSSSCLWGACGQADGGSVCTEASAPGTPCSVNHDCASGRCEQGQCLAACIP